MKFLAALLLVVASVHSNSLNYYGWAPGKEMVFNYHSQVLSGIPEISDSHWSGVKMNAKVIVQSYSDYSMRLRIDEPEFWTINGQNIRLSETGRVMREQESTESVKVESITQEFKRFLLEPFLVHMKAGVVESLLISKNEPASVTNIKKSILSQIQIDVAGTRRTQLETNHIKLPVSEESNEQISYFTTMEESVQGECKTEYSIHKLPQWKINEVEEAWRTEELKVRDFHIESEAKSVCQGKPYFLITKTKSLEQCKKSPVYHMYARSAVATTGMNSISEFGNTMSTTHAYVCGELNSFVVRKVAHKMIADQTITGYNTEERAVSPSQVTMSLLKIQPITTRLSVPATTKVVTSILYGYPVERHQLNQEVVEKTEELIGMSPLLPQPTLTQAPHNILLNLPKEEIVPQILQQIQKMAREVYQSPESCASKSDVAGKLSTLTLYMRSLSLVELEQLESKIVSSSSSTGMKTIEYIFYDILSLVGTNPSAMLVIKKVKEGSLPVSLLTKIVSYTIRNVRYPTQELMEELVKMIELTNVKAHKQLFTTAMLQLSNLFYHAYINPTTMSNNFPTKVFGVFGTKESQVMTEKYIPFLVEEIERTESEHVRLSAILALGKIGHLKGLKTLIKEIEQVVPATSDVKKTKVQARRTIAINALKRLAKMNPTELRPILMSVIVNPVESAEVRIAAISVLPFAQPTTAELQKLAVSTWKEPSTQVSSFIVSTLRSLANSQVPELKSVGLKARSVLQLIKEEQYGIQHSHNINHSSFVEYLRLLINNQYQLVNSKESLIPHKMSLKTVYYGPSNTLKLPAIEFSAYTYGMDFLLEKYLHFFSNDEQTTSTIKQQLNKITEELKLKTRELSTPFSFVFGSLAGMESSLYLDSEIVLDTIEKLTTKFEAGLDIEFNHVGAHQVFDASYMLVTEAGFPILATSTMPIIYSVKGSVKVSPGNMFPKVLGKVVPVLNGKIQTHFGIISPFTREMIGTGVEMSVHSSLPIEIEGEMGQGEVQLSIRIPTEVERSGRQTETIHGFVLPYTFKYNLLTVTPLSHSTNLRKIVSGINRLPVNMEVGKSWGLSARVQYHSDAKFVDLFSYIQKVTQHTPLSIIPSAILPSSVRMSSLSLEYSPAKSETKALYMAFRLSTKGMMHSLSKKNINEHQISPKFSQVKSVLSQVERANVVEITGVTKSSSGTELKKIHTVVVLGHRSTHHLGHLAAVEVLKQDDCPKMGCWMNSADIELLDQDECPKMGCWMNSADIEIPAPQLQANSPDCAILCKEGNGGAICNCYDFPPIRSPTIDTETFGLKYEGEIELPTLMNRWNVEKMIEEPLKGGFQGEFYYGKPAHLKSIKIIAELEKTEELKREIRLSPEYKKCMIEQRYQKVLTPACNVVRHQAAALDKLKLTIKAPQAWSRSSILSLLDGVSKSLLVGNIEAERAVSGTEGVLIAEARADRTSQLISMAKVVTPARVMIMKNIRLMGLTKFLLPATVLRTPIEVAALKMTANRIPSTCRVEPSFVRTFDDMTVNYEINDCEHVLLLDGSKDIPISITTKTDQSQKKIVKILSGITEIQMIPISGSMKVMVNGEQIVLPTVGEQLIKKNSEGKILVILKNFQDNVISVYVPEQGLQVLSNGSMIEVVAPHLLKARTVGLCGDMNGERSVDIKTPRMCIMKPQLAALSFMLNKSGSASGFERCSGIPSSVRAEFMREVTQCSREIIIPTPVSKLYQHISVLNMPTGMMHVVDKQSNQLCISKQMVKICSSKPLSIKQKSVEFACVKQPSTQARSLEKRALSGESLFQEISNLPTAFRRAEYEASACKSEVSSISL